MNVCVHLLSHIIVPCPTDTPPVMMGGANVAAVAVPVVLVLLVIGVVGAVCLGFYIYYRNKGLE